MKVAQKSIAKGRGILHVFIETESRLLILSTFLHNIDMSQLYMHTKLTYCGIKRIKTYCYRLYIKNIFYMA